MTINWQRLKLGAGGLITGIDQANDGTKVCRADVFGAYIYDSFAPNTGNAGGLGNWRQLMTTSSLGSFVNRPASNNGAFELRIAPSNSNILYMVFDGICWYTTDRGFTWAQTAFNSFTQNDLPSNTGQQRLTQYKMAVDPANTDVVILGALTHGFYRTAGGTTGGAWSVLTGLATPDGNGFNQVAFDSSGGVTSGKTNNIYIAVGGTGVYKSTNQGSTWTLTTGSPANVYSMAVSSTGVVYATDYFTAKLYRFQSGTWTDITPSSFTGAGAPAQFIILDPTDNTHALIFSYSSGACETSNATTASTSAGWTALNTHATFTCTDVPWLSTIGGGLNGGWPGIGTPIWDTLNTNTIWFSGQQGVITTTVPLTTSPTPQVLTSVSSGIEEIVASKVLLPPGGNPLLFCGDVAVLQSTNPNSYITQQAFNATSGHFLEHAFAGDYSKTDSSFVCAVINNEGPETSGSSASYGAPGTWSKFASYPGRSAPGGMISCATSLNMVWVQSNRSDLWNTKDGGATWTLRQPTNIQTAVGTNTTTTASAISGATSIVVASTTDMNVNGKLEINADGSSYTITGIVGTTVSFTSAPGLPPGLSTAIASGAPVYVRRTVTSAVASGVTSLALATVTGLVANNYLVEGNGNAIKINTIVGHTVNLNSATQLSYNVGDEIGPETGWGFAQYLGRKVVCADYVNVGTFYAQNAGLGNGTGLGFGTYKSTDGGDTWSLVSLDHQGMDLGGGGILKPVPGNAGHLFFTSGFIGSGGDPATNWPHGGAAMFYSTDGGAHWNDVSSLSAVLGVNQFTVSEIWQFCFGKAAPGQSYPAIYLYGWVNAGASPSAAGSVPAIYQSIDQCKTWTQMGTQYPIGWPDGIADMEGSLDTYGTVYLGYSGSGFAFGRIPGTVVPLRMRLHT